MEPDQRPEFLTDDMLTYLDDLRASGKINMFGTKLALAALILLTISQAALADCTLTVAITNQGRPAFEPITSVIYAGDQFVAAENRHSYTIALPCDREYQLVATPERGSPRSRNIVIKVDSRIKLDMGN